VGADVRRPPCPDTNDTTNKISNSNVKITVRSLRKIEASARDLVKHAGLCPRDNESGHFSGTSTTSRRGRPGLRLAAWRAVGAALLHNPVLAARHAHLTGRAERLDPGSDDDFAGLRRST
jgi:hypothetical protein